MSFSAIMCDPCDGHPDLLGASPVLRRALFTGNGVSRQLGIHHIDFDLQSSDVVVP